MADERGMEPLSDDELAQQEAQDLPDREAMSLINPTLVGHGIAVPGSTVAPGPTPVPDPGPGGIPVPDPSPTP